MSGLKLTLLGTGGVWAAPVPGCNCAACLRARKDNSYKRNPASALIDYNGTRLLIDAGLEDLPERFPPETIDGILLTHFHMDHVLGLFRLRWHKGKPIPVYCPPDTLGCDDLLKHQIGLDFKEQKRFKRFELSSLGITPVPLVHSKLCFGWCLDIGPLHIAYLTDTVGLPEETAAYLKTINYDLIILDCAYPPGDWPHQNHNDLAQALEIAHHLNAKQTILTHINHELDEFLMSYGNLPDNVSVLQDNSCFKFSDV